MNLSDLRSCAHDETQRHDHRKAIRKRKRYVYGLQCMAPKKGKKETTHQKEKKRINNPKERHDCL